ncbi:MAG: hypothetical protein JXB25_11015, partial [Deltaproteobacteria bacterium]|nr:hypothetical protein [Deltaproteobacteria bacterium]
MKSRINFDIGVLFLGVLSVAAPAFGKDVTLTWSPSTGATGYKIYCQADNPTPPFPLCGDTGSTATTYTVTG